MATTLQEIKQALQLDDFDAQSAHGKMAPVTRAPYRSPEIGGSPRLGAVLLLLFQRHGEAHVVLTRRREDLSSHAGQISFPGGRNEAPETLLTTALRETEEEVGVGPAFLELLGALTPIYIPPSDYEVHPFVAWYKNGKEPRFRAAPQEVAQIIEAPLSRLLDPAARVEELWSFDDRQIVVPYFAVWEHKVWGATAIMLSEMIERLRVISS